MVINKTDTGQVTKAIVSEFINIFHRLMKLLELVAYGRSKGQAKSFFIFKLLEVGNINIDRHLKKNRAIEENVSLRFIHTDFDLCIIHKGRTH